jgi:hypothetical protein
MRWTASDSQSPRTCKVGRGFGSLLELCIICAYFLGTTRASCSFISSLLLAFCGPGQARLYSTFDYGGLSVKNRSLLFVMDLTGDEAVPTKGISSHAL